MFMIVYVCIYFRHSDLKHDHKCGYDGGINKTHDEDLYKNTEFNRILRVSFFLNKIKSFNVICYLNFVLIFLFYYLSLEFHSTNVRHHHHHLIM